MKTVHYYNVYDNNFGSPGDFVQVIKLFRLNKDTVRIASAIKTNDYPASRFHVNKRTGALHYVPRRNHVGYILEEVKV